MFDSLRKRITDNMLKNRDSLSEIKQQKKTTTYLQKESKTQKNIQNTSFLQQLKQNHGKSTIIVQNKQSFRHLVSNNVGKSDFEKFISAAHRGTVYSLKFLKGPSEKYLESKKVKLQEPKNSKQKFLFLDLDETLIHSVAPQEPYDVQLKFEDDDDSIYFNIRPGCYEFLQRMNQHFTIYIFTASTIGYAQPIVQYLNIKKHIIHGILPRTNCMQTRNGFFIKDLRIVANRSLKDIILVDNLVHSFGLQIDNGIPITDFRDQMQDKQLQHVQKILMKLKDEQDVRVFLSKELQIRKLAMLKQKQLLGKYN